jgi:signal transduction histidine kinase
MTKHHLTRGAMIVALWAVIGFFLTLEVYFNVRVSRPDVEFWDVALGQYQRALLWAVLAPLVVQLKGVVPLSRGRWAGGVAFHLAASFAVMAGYYLVRSGYMYLHSGARGSAGFWAEAAGGFYGRNLIDMAFYWAVIGVVYALEMKEKYQRENLKAAQLESRLIETELKALKHQLNPHFLFNTLNTISVLVREQKNEQAVSLIARLSTLLRLSLDNTRVQTVTLKQELEFLGSYLEIQKARFGERLKYTAEAEPDALRGVIPNLILQPIVENAIMHGIAKKIEPGHVRIEARVKEGKLEIAVSDDGPGIDAEKGRVREGIGLTNTRERLERHFGKNHQMVLKSEKGRGVTVGLVLPYQAAAEAHN